jgi:hypothetical protein
MHNLLIQNDLKRLITALRAKYATQFNKNFPSEGKNAFPVEALELEAAKNLVGVTPMQFERGLALLYTSVNKFMPSFADFRSMCVGEDWWNPQKAWVKACEYTKIVDHKKTELPNGEMQYREITKLAKFALDQVKHYINDGEMYQAKDEFIRLYESYVAEAQFKGRFQEWYQEPTALTWSETKKDFQPIDSKEALTHLEQLKKRLNVKNREIHKPQKLKPSNTQTMVHNEWPDPFENPKEYLNSCDMDGVHVPVEIRRQFEGK